MKFKIKITGTKPIWFGERKVLPGETAVVEDYQINRKNKRIQIIESVKKQTKRRTKKDGNLES